MTIQEQISLKNHNTFGINVSAKYYSEISDIQEYIDCARFASSHSIAMYLIGGGSNLLLTSDLICLVVKNQIKGIKIVNETQDFIYLSSASGEVWHELVLYTIAQGWGGLENLSLIPGSVGAAPIQNIGAYGVELKDVFESLTALNRETLQEETFDLNACGFGYRESVFKNELKGKYFITSVTLKLSKNPKTMTNYGAIGKVLKQKNIEVPTIKDVSQAVIEIRQSKLPDPAKIGNSGSFFKNPVVTKDLFEKLKISNPEMPFYLQEDHTYKIPAGWLIEQAGWKGHRSGDVGVHQYQALVLVNYGNGSGQEIKSLAEKIQKSIKNQFEIDLSMEVNVV